MAKTKIRSNFNAQLIEKQTKQRLRNRYFNIFMNQLTIEGVDHMTNDYILKHLYTDGNVCLFNLKNYGVVADSWAMMTYGLYGQPSKVSIINTWNIPNYPQYLTNGVDCVIGYLNRGHESVRQMTEYYVDRITQLWMSFILNTETSKLPFVITGTADCQDAVKDFIDRLTSNQLALWLDSETAQSVGTLGVAKFALNDIWTQIQNLDAECLAQLALDCNSINFNRATVDQVNANNQLINNIQQGWKYELEKMAETANSILGCNISIKFNTQLVESLHNEQVQMEAQEDGNN